MSRKSQPPKSDRAASPVLESEQLQVAMPGAMHEVSITAIVLPKSQPRRYFDSVKMDQLIESIRTHGILENLIVRPVGECEGQYELVAGERRYRGAIAAGLTVVPVSVRQLSDNEALALGLVENLQREDLSAIDETEAILQLLALRLKLSVEEAIPLLYRMQDELKGKVPLNVLGNEKGQTVQNVFDELGKLTWESFVSSRLPLLKLPSEILSQVRTGTINYTKAVAIAKVKQEAERKALLDEALASQLTLSQIRERVRTLQPTDQPQSPKAKIQAVVSRVTKSKVWENKEKWQRVSALLEELSALVG